MQIIIAVIARALSAQTFGKMEISSTEKVFASAPERAGMRIPLPYNGMRQTDGRTDTDGLTMHSMLTSPAPAAAAWLPRLRFR